MTSDLATDATNVDGPDVDRTALFESLSVRDLTLANRIVMAPMTRGFARDGQPSEAVARYYERRALGGVGLIVTEAVGVPHPSALGNTEVDTGDLPHMYGKHALAGWRRVMDGVHRAGGAIAPQLWHQGPLRLQGTGPVPSARSMRPSGLWGTVGTRTAFTSEWIERIKSATEAMSEQDIRDVIDAYAAAALNALSVGADAIAIHGGHGYLIDSFLWDGTNHRDDEWGGDDVRRANLAKAIVSTVRSAVGDGVPIIFRFSQWKQQDFMARLAQDPTTLGRVLAPLAAAGVDIFEGSVRYFDRPEFEGSSLNLSGWAKKLTGKMAMTVGGVGMQSGMYDSRVTGSSAASDNVDLAARRLEAGEFELVAVGRALLQDPNWAERIRYGVPTSTYWDGSRAALI